MTTTMWEIFFKNALDRVNYRLDTAEENISELENVATETIQNKTQKKIFLIKNCIVEYRTTPYDLTYG